MARGPQTNGTRASNQWHAGLKPMARGPQTMNGTRASYNNWPRASHNNWPRASHNNWPRACKRRLLPCTMADGHTYPYSLAAGLHQYNGCCRLRYQTNTSLCNAMPATQNHQVPAEHHRGWAGWEIWQENSLPQRRKKAGGKDEHQCHRCFACPGPFCTSRIFIHFSPPSFIRSSIANDLSPTLDNQYVIIYHLAGIAHAGHLMRECALTWLCCAKPTFSSHTHAPTHTRARRRTPAYRCTSGRTPVYTPTTRSRHTSSYNPTRNLFGGCHKY